MTDSLFDDAEQVLKDENLESVTAVEELKQRSWDRDKLSQRFSDVRSNRQTIERIIRDIQQQIDSIPDDDELREKYSGFLDEVSTDSMGQPKTIPRPMYDAVLDRFELMMRHALWQSRLDELEWFAVEMFKSKCLEILEEHRTAQSFDKLENMVESRAETFASEKVDEKVQELDSKISQVEKVAQATREERKSLWGMIERVAEKETNSLTVEELEDVVDRSLDDFVDRHGVFSLDEQELSASRKAEERKSAADSAAESVAGENGGKDNGGSDDHPLSHVEVKGDDGVYLLKDKDELRLRAYVLEEMYREQDLNERVESGDVSKSDVADLTDMTVSSLFYEDGVVTKAVEEFNADVEVP